MIVDYAELERAFDAEFDGISSRFTQSEEVIARKWFRIGYTTAARQSENKMSPKCVDGFSCSMPTDCPRAGFCLADNTPQNQ